jgi:hypothetical protein
LIDIRTNDWIWLVEKYENRIRHWCTRWLSLGGRLVLIKAVLECQPVYWLTLANLPATIQNKIRQIIFNFLWSGSRKKKNYHLCNWQLIARPKHLGGWGLRSLTGFSRALAAHSLWRAVLNDGLWQRVLKEKYYPFVSVHRWFRTVEFHRSRGSQTWQNLLKSIHLLLHWMVWSPGDGTAIVIGKDRILEMGEVALLSEELIATLNSKGIYYLFQAQKTPNVGMISSNWHTNEDLNLAGHLREEWNLYRRALINNGVLIQQKSDSLKWAGGNKSGVISVKNIYLASENLRWSHILGGWRRASWGWTVPLKIKLFIWLLAEEKILLWGNLQRRGHSGPGICHLCKNNEETTQHLFMDCAFTVDVWLKLKSALNFHGRWTGNNFMNALKVGVEQTQNCSFYQP